MEHGVARRWRGMEEANGGGGGAWSSWRMEGVTDGGARGRCNAEEARGSSEEEVRGSSEEEG